MSNHISIVVKGKIDWKSNNYVLVVGNRRSNPTNLKAAIEYARACELKGKRCFVQEIPEKLDTPEDTQTNIFDATLLKGNHNV